MASDPFPTDPASETVIVDMLDEEAQERGYDDWVEAYHKLDLDVS